MSNVETNAAVAEAPQQVKPDVQPEVKADSQQETKAEGKSRKRRVQENAPVEQVPLLRIDNSIFDNYRRLSSNAELEKYVESIRINGLKQNLVAGQQPDGKLGLSCGFQRFECLQRIALEDVVEEYNKHFGYKPGDEKYVYLSGMPKGFAEAKDWRANVREMQDNRAVIRQASPEWAKKFDDALAAYKVNVQVKTYKHAKEAVIDNIEENELRSNPSLADKTARIVAMLDTMSGTEVARATGESNATVSHYKRINNLIPFLQGMRREASVHTGLKDEEGNPALSNFLRKIDGVIAELDRRMKVSEDDPCRLQMQQLRELSHTIDPKNEADRPPLTVIVDVVGELVRTNADGSATGNPTYDMSTFKARVKDTIALDKSRREAAAAAAQAAAQPNLGTPSAGQPQANIVGMLAPEAMAANQPAQPQDKTPSVDAATAVDASLVQAAQQALGQVPAGSATAAATPGGVVAPTDAQRQAAIDQANASLATDASASGGAEVDLGGTTEISMANLIPSVDDLKKEVGEAPSRPDDGQMRSKTGEATKSRYTPLPPDKVESLADTTIKELSSELSQQTCSPFDIIQLMGQSKQLYYILGLSDKQEVVNTALIGYVEKVRVWADNLESQLAKHAPQDIVSAVKSLKPEFPRVELPNG